MPLTCSYCHAEVARVNCHRNRYGEMICHACQRTGVQYTLRSRLRSFGKRTPLYIGIGLAIAGTLLLFIWFLYLIVLSEPQRLLH